jgi:hypothetical protein
LERAKEDTFLKHVAMKLLARAVRVDVGV